LYWLEPISKSKNFSDVLQAYFCLENAVFAFY
jgi:hypothetical protein